MVDIAGAAAGPQLYGRPDPLVNGAQTSQVAADGVAPDQAIGVTAPGDLDAEGDGSGGQGDFENPASGENIFQAQLAGSEEELAGTERPLSPIEEAILDFFDFANSASRKTSGRSHNVKMPLRGTESWDSLNATSLHQ